MRLRGLCGLATLVCVIGLLWGVLPLSAQSPQSADKATASDDGDAAIRSAAAKARREADDVVRVPVELARERARLAHSIYSSTLDVIHRTYFHDDRSVIPAHAMEDIFARIARENHLKARWIAVNAQAMNIDHRPQDDFERQAARAIKSGLPDYERIENGMYRRAQGISLMNHGCLTCHVGLGASGKVQRFAGLVISIPVQTGPAAAD